MLVVLDQFFLDTLVLLWRRLCPDLYEIGGGGEKNSGHCRAAKLQPSQLKGYASVLRVC